MPSLKDRIREAVDSRTPPIGTKALDDITAAVLKVVEAELPVGGAEERLQLKAQIKLLEAERPKVTREQIKSWWDSSRRTTVGEDTGVSHVVIQVRERGVTVVDETEVT